MTDTKTKLQKLKDFLSEFGDDFEKASEKAKSALMRATVPENIATSVVTEAISHRITMVNLSVQESFLTKAVVFSRHCEDTFRVAIWRLFHVAEERDMTDEENDAQKTQVIVISSLIGHAVEGCFQSTETPEEARKMLSEIVNQVFNHIRENFVEEEDENEEEEKEPNASGSSSIH
jgi:predicted RNase H-like HicB family nuclease